ncbi:MAG: ParA family partition ATPase [Nitrosotalea sp.]
MIISILNEKGGVGKTTLTTNLARAFHLRNQKVLLVDSDPQGSARDWHVNGNGEMLEVVGLDRPTLDKDIIKFKSRYDMIFIDGAPQITEMVVKAILCSDIVLIPVQPSPYDIWASKSLVDLIKQRQQITGGLPKAAFVISRQIVKTRMGNEVRAVLEDYDLPVFSYGTCQRIVYAETAAKGNTVLEGDDDSAEKELMLIADEFEYFSGMKKFDNFSSPLFSRYDSQKSAFE